MLTISVTDGGRQVNYFFFYMMNAERQSAVGSVEIVHVGLVAVTVALLWLLFAGELHIQEVVAASIAGVATGVAGYTLRRRTGHRQVGFSRWLRHLPGILLQALSDCWTLFVTLFRTMAGRHSRGAFRRVPFEVGADDPDDIGRRVLATIGTTLQPNSYVIGFNRERGEVLVHQLDPTPEFPIADDIRRAR